MSSRVGVLLGATLAVAGMAYLMSRRKRRDATNSALIFIKPHGNTVPVQEFVKAELRTAGMTIVKTGDLPGVEIKRRGTIDNHYAAIARYATILSAKDLPVSASVKAEFEKKYGASWDSLVAAGKVLNITEAQLRLGVDETELSKLTEAARKDGFRLAPGLYTTFIEDKAKDGRIFVINGFYGGMRAEYVDPHSVVTWMVIEWPEKVLSWRNFRGGVLGATDPSIASAGSLRAQIKKEYKRFELSFDPSTGKNCVHGSASPLEALKERIIWTGVSVEKDPFGRQLLDLGLSKDDLNSILDNPTFNAKPLFDVVEDLDTSETLTFFQEKFVAKKRK